jgi:hypothetical protein
MVADVLAISPRPVRPSSTIDVLACGPCDHFGIPPVGLIVQLAIDGKAGRARAAPRNSTQLQDKEHHASDYTRDQKP